MGIFSRQRALFDSAATPTSLASPWAEPGNLISFVAPDIFGAEIAAKLPLTRESALSIPAVARARNLLVSIIAALPLVAQNKDGVLANQPVWLYRSDTGESTYSRMAATVDDLMFFGKSLWVVSRGAEGQITDATWVAPSEWQITNGQVRVLDQPVSDRDVVLFHIPRWDGLLVHGSRTLRGAIDMENAWVQKVKNPVPLTVLRHTSSEGRQLEDDEVQHLLTQWRTARRDEDGAIGYLPPELQMEVFGTVDPALYVEGRNAVRTDIGSLLNIPTSMLDGSLEASSTYDNAQGQVSRFYSESLPFWLDPIVQRLSQDDVVPRGQSVRANFTNALAETPAPIAPAED